MVSIYYSIASRSGFFSSAGYVFFRIADGRYPTNIVIRSDPPVSVLERMGRALITWVISGTFLLALSQVCTACPVYNGDRTEVWVRIDNARNRQKPDPDLEQILWKYFFFSLPYYDFYF